jgi:hypothetical protein
LANFFYFWVSKKITIESALFVEVHHDGREYFIVAEHRVEFGPFLEVRVTGVEQCLIKGFVSELLVDSLESRRHLSLEIADGPSVRVRDLEPFHLPVGRIDH